MPRARTARCSTNQFFVSVMINEDMTAREMREDWQHNSPYHCFKFVENADACLENDPVTPGFFGVLEACSVWSWTKGGVRNIIAISGHQERPF